DRPSLELGDGRQYATSAPFGTVSTSASGQIRLYSVRSSSDKVTHFSLRRPTSCWRRISLGHCDFAKSRIKGFLAVCAMRLQSTCSRLWASCTKAALPLKG